MVETMASLKAFPSFLLPRAWSRALIPFPFPFERLPCRLRRNIKSNKLIHLEPYDYRIYNVTLIYVISMEFLTESLTSPLAKRPSAGGEELGAEKRLYSQARNNLEIT